MLNFILPSFFKFSIFHCHSNEIHMDNFSVQDFSATTLLSILKFGTKRDSDELFCVTKTATYCISVPLFVHFSLFPMKISVADFYAPLGASVFKFCEHLQVG